MHNLEKLKDLQEEKFKQECTFVPQINMNHQSRRNSDTNDVLYYDAIRRQHKRESNETKH